MLLNCINGGNNLRKVKLLVLFSILFLLMIIPMSFAEDNETLLAADYSNQTVSVSQGDVLTSDIYFDSNIESDSGDGSQYNPYKYLKSVRIKEGSTIHLADGEYSLDKYVSLENLNVVGNNPKKTVISYSGKGFDSSGSLTLKNVTLLGCSISNKGSLNIENTIFKNIEYGDSIHSSTKVSAVDLNNCTFSGNYAPTDGVISVSDGNLTIKNSQFINNHAIRGGAININGGNLAIENTIFNSNYATICGGSVYAKGNAKVTISRSQFLNGYAVGDGGGAIYLLDSNMDSDYMEIVNCTSTFGGAIVSLSSKLKLNSFTGKNNKAEYDGGSIYVMYRSFSIVNSYLTNNLANDGGALHVNNVEDFVIKSNTFVNNVALNSAGAVYSVGSDCYYDSIMNKGLNNTFINNEALVNKDVFESKVPDVFIGNGNYTLVKYNSSGSGNLPSYFNLKDLGYVTPVKNQGNGGNCWAFSTLGALESCILKATGISYDLSEENMKNLMALYSDYGWPLETNTGGYDKMGIGYLTSWLGPVNESDDPYDAKSLLSPVLKSYFHIQNIAYLTRSDRTDNDKIKRALMDYGAVQTSIYWSSTYAKGKSYYYDGSNSPNHAVIIVGWDDTYSKDNFKNKPEGDGAWIIRNSWGTSSGDKGYYYVSYYDSKCAPINKSASIFTFILNDTIKYDKNYQYDIPGCTDYFINSTSVVWYKNRFTATGAEYLSAASTFFSKDTTWELSVYVNNVLKLTKKGTASPGYKTIDLGQLIPLKKGDFFDIVFKINVDKEASVPISEAVSLNTEFYSKGISFISYDGKKWADLYDLEWTYPDHTYNSQVACIKAFTVLNEINTQVVMTLSRIDDKNSNLVATVFDEYGNIFKGQGNVVFTIGGVDKTVDITNGVANYGKVVIGDGINKFSAKFTPKQTGYKSSGSEIAVSNKLINSIISLKFSSSRYNPLVIDAYVKDQYGKSVVSGVVTFNIDGVDYKVNVVNGVASMSHVFKTFGLKTISARYDDLYCYNSSQTVQSVSMDIIGTSISLNMDYPHNPAVITASITDSNGNKVNKGAVIFNVEGIDHKVNVANGKASLTHIFNRFGFMKIEATYFDDSYLYNSSHFMGYFEVSLIKTALELNIPSTDVKNPVDLICTVKDSYGKIVNMGTVTFKLKDENKVVNVVDGKAELNYTFKNTGINVVTISYNDGYYYDTSSKVVSLNVSKTNVELSLKFEENGGSYKIIVEISKPISDYVRIYVDGKPYMVKSTMGKAILDVGSLACGNHKIKAEMSSYIYSSDVVERDLFVEFKQTVITCANFFYFNEKISCPITLKDESGNAVNGAKLTVKINQKTYTVTTDASGVAWVELNLAVGDYTIEISFGGNERYFKSNLTDKFTVKSTVTLPEQFKYAYNSIYKATLLDAKGNPLKNKEVTLNIDGKTYNVLSDDNGVISYNIKMNKGNYVVSLTNPVTTEAKTQSINVVSRLVGKGITMYYGSGKYYKVRAYDDGGNVAKGVRVTIKFNGRTYYRNTDSNGYASLKISARAKTYIAYASYNGCTIKNKIVVKPRLITKNVAVKRSKTFTFTAKLLSTSGKIMKNKVITIKFKSKTYKARTNYKGIAAVKLKSGAKIGKFTVLTSYGSLKNSNKITVKK